MLDITEEGEGKIIKAINLSPRQRSKKSYSTEGGQKVQRIQV